MHESEAWGYSEASSASVCSISTYWLQIYLFNSETVWNKRRIKFNPPPEEEYYSLISRSTWNLNAKWATSCRQNARQKLNKIQRIQEVFITNYENVRKTPQHFLSADNGWQFQETSIQGQNRIKTQTGGRSNRLTYSLHWTKILRWNSWKKKHEKANH